MKIVQPKITLGISVKRWKNNFCKAIHTAVRNASDLWCQRQYITLFNNKYSNMALSGTQPVLEDLVMDFTTLEVHKTLLSNRNTKIDGSELSSESHRLPTVVIEITN